MVTFHEMALNSGEANKEAEKLKLASLHAGWEQVKNDPSTASLLRDLLKQSQPLVATDHAIISKSKLIKWVHESGRPCVWVGTSEAATTRAKELGYVPPDISAPAATPALHANDSSSPPQPAVSEDASQASSSAAAVATVVERVERAARMSVSAAASVAQLEAIIHDLPEKLAKLNPKLSSPQARSDLHELWKTVCGLQDGTTEPSAGNAPLTVEIAIASLQRQVSHVHEAAKHTGRNPHCK